jgi:hypothetical protein
MTQTGSMGLISADPLSEGRHPRPKQQDNGAFSALQQGLARTGDYAVLRPKAATVAHTVFLYEFILISIVFGALRTGVEWRTFRTEELIMLKILEVPALTLALVFAPNIASAECFGSGGCVGSSGLYLGPDAFRGTLSSPTNSWHPPPQNTVPQTVQRGTGIRAPQTGVAASPQRSFSGTGAH